MAQLGRRLLRPCDVAAARDQAGRKKLPDDGQDPAAAEADGLPSPDGREGETPLLLVAGRKDSMELYCSLILEFGIARTG